MSRSLLLKPRLSEKAYALSEAEGAYVFEVPQTATKQQIAEAVRTQYSVGVASVRVTKTAGKRRRTVRRRGRNIYKGHSSAVHKAYVRLNEGDKLPIFAGAKEDDKDAAAIEGTDKPEISAKNTKEIRPVADKGVQAVKTPEKKGRRFGLYTRGEK